VPKKRSVEEILETALKNVDVDRAKADILLTDLILYLKSSVDRHEKVGAIAAKYLETLQRSNEQLVKIAELIRKKSSFSPNLSEDDMENIFDKLQEDQQASSDEEEE